MAFQMVAAVALTAAHLMAAKELRPFGPRVRIAILLVVLPLFAEVYHYTADIYPLYAASKLWTFITIPLVLFGFAICRLPARELYVVTLAYVIPIPPVLAMIHLGVSFPDALTAIIKIIPIASYFSLFMLLALLRPTAREVQKSITILGAATFILLAVLWETVPQSGYKSEFGLPSIFIGNDDIRGDRIVIPMFFGLLFLFQLARRFFLTRQIRYLIILLVCYWLMSTIYKERIPILCSFLVIMLAYAEGVMRSRFLALLVVGTAGLALLSIGLAIIGLDTVSNALGGSLAVRLMSIDIAWDFLRDNPARWFFGSGATGSYAQVPLNKIFGNPAFFLADLGWLGVVFEYGMIGAGLILAIHVTGVVIATRMANPTEPVSQALADYAFYLLPASLIYSTSLQPGEIATITALAVYLRRAR